MLTFLILLQKFYIAPLQDCLLRSAPSPASVKHNGLGGREEGDGAINGYLAVSDRKPIPGRRASNRKGTALPSGSPLPFAPFFTLLSTLVTANTTYTFYFFSLHHCTDRFSSLHIFVHHCTFCASLHVKTSPAVRYGPP